MINSDSLQDIMASDSMIVLKVPKTSKISLQNDSREFFYFDTEQEATAWCRNYKVDFPEIEERAGKRKNRENILKDFECKLLENSKDVSSKKIDMVSENFWELLYYDLWK